jgi:fatty acid desaturase
MSRVYRRTEDFLPSLLVLAIFAVQLCTFALVDNLWLVLLVALILLALSASPGAISHNHHHCPTFRHAWMNRVYEVILFLETGVTPYAWTLHHNLGHHKHYLEPHEDTAPWIDARGRVMSRLRYDVVGALRIYPECLRIARRHPELTRRFLRWSAISLAVLGVLIWIDPVKALVLFVLPMPFMYIGLLDNTYMQHSRLDLGSAVTASRNTTSRLYNLLSWNLGYHTAHHMRPSLHWSELPHLHEKIRVAIPNGLVCDSVFLSACRAQPAPSTSSTLPER